MSDYNKKELLIREEGFGVAMGVSFVAFAVGLAHYTEEPLQFAITGLCCGIICISYGFYQRSRAKAM